MALYKSEAILLRTRNWGDADRMVTLFTREYGKIVAMAKGARRPRNHLSGGLQPFSHCNLLLLSGKNLDLITQCEVLNPFRLIVEDLDKIAYASCIVEILAELMPEKEPGPDVFQLLLDTLKVLEKHQPRLVSLSFILKILAFSGFYPNFTHCVKCGASVTLPARFSAENGGVVCSHCASQTGAELSAQTLQSLKVLQNLDLTHPGSFSLSGAAVRSGELLLYDYLEHILDKPLKTLSMLKILRSQENSARIGHTREEG